MERKDRIDAIGAVALIGFAAAMAFNPVVIKLGNGGFQPVFMAALRSAGALLVLVADSAVRVLPLVTELRLGIALSLLGAPFFLWLLLRMRRGLA